MPQLVPVILAVSAVAGIGLQVAGTAQAAKASKQRSQYEQQIAADQQRQEALRRQQMELENSRRRVEAIRQQQRASALARATAENQGASFGSGLQGGFGQISGQTGTNLLGLSQSLALGRANFDINSDISSARYGIASANSNYATGQGLSSLGGGIISSLGPIGNLAGGFYPGSSSYSAGPSGGGQYYSPYGPTSGQAIY